MERTLSKLITYPVNGHVNGALPSTISGKTRRVYDALSLVYPMSTFFFHSKAHQYALEMSGIRDGMRVLEVATGSGEMFHRLVSANPNGSTVGLDLSPNMAAKTQKIVRRKFPTRQDAMQSRGRPIHAVPGRKLRCGDVLLSAGIAVGR